MNIEICNEMKKIRNLLILLITSLLFASCLDNNESDFNANADVYVIKKKTGDADMYAKTFYVYGNQMMQSASVTETGGSGGKIDLIQDYRSIFVMSKLPQESDYLPYPPVTNDYLFQVTSEGGITKEYNDFLSFDDIGIPEIDSIYFSDNNKYLNVAWTEVDGTDGYLIKILNTEGEEVLNGYGFGPEVLEYQLNVLLANWVITPVQGETYVVQVHAFAYEPEFETGYEAYNIQEVAIDEKEIIWP